MNKKYFKEAIDEIHVDERVKREVLNKIKPKKRISLRPILATATMCLIALVMGFFYQKRPVNPMPIMMEEEKLQGVGNFENLYEMLQKSASKTTNYYNSRNSWELSVDSVSPDASIAGTQAKSMETTTIGDIVSRAESFLNEGNKDYSKTNVQVEGVDEADIVKTDGEYIYYLTSSKIVIVNAKDEKNMKIEAEIEYQNEKQASFSPRELYILKNKLIVVGTKYYRNEAVNKYNYYSQTNYVTAKVYNIKNKNEIKLDREVEVEGNYLSSRMIGGNIYLIANKSLYLYNLRNTKIEDVKEENYQVKYKDTAVSNAICPVGYDRMYCIPEQEYSSYINIAAFNVNEEKEANVKTYIGAGNEIYCSTNNLYITNNIYEYKDYGFYSSSKTSVRINKFKLQDAKVEFVASGEVPGTPINQFAMDEKDGYFRIATTNRTKLGNTNNLYVLNENMEQVGKVEGLARGERIYSVRFMGNRAYMVTFVETDPLFVIDLSKPTEPKVLGELKIPGYSKYLHPYDETHLIGFGEDTVVENYGYGNIVRTNGMKMALFDVSDPTNPKEMYVEKIGEQGTYSELLENHKALLFSKEKNIIAFPISIREDNYKTSFQGAVVYGLTLEKGFELKGKITHRKAEENQKYSYDYSKKVERIIYIKDNLFTLSKGLIKATNMNTMEEKGEVEIKVQNERYNYYDYGIIE